MLKKSGLAVFILLLALAVSVGAQEIREPRTPDVPTDPFTNIEVVVAPDSPLQISAAKGFLRADRGLRFTAHVDSKVPGPIVTYAVELMVFDSHGHYKGLHGFFLDPVVGSETIMKLVNELEFDRDDVVYVTVAWAGDRASLWTADRESYNARVDSLEALRLGVAEPGMVSQSTALFGTVEPMSPQGSGLDECDKFCVRAETRCDGKCSCGTQEFSCSCGATNSYTCKCFQCPT